MMRPKRSRVVAMLTLVVALAMLASACSSAGDNNEQSATTAAGETAQSTTTAAGETAQSTTTAAGETAQSTTTAAGEEATAPEVGSQAQFDLLGIGSPRPELCEGRDKIVVGYDVFSDTQDYVVAMNENLATVAEEMGGCVEFITTVDNLDPAVALANVQTFIQRRVDAVLLFQVVASGQPGIMAILNEAGIPTIAHAVPADAGSTFISQSDIEVSELNGKTLVAGVKERYPGETPFVILGNQPAVGVVSENRVDHQADVIRAAFPEMTDDDVVFVETDGTPDDAFNKTLNIIAKVPTDRPILISGINDDVVVSMFRALDQSGKSGKLIAVGINAAFPIAIEAMCKNEQFIASVDFAPGTLGRYMVPALLAVVDGVELPDVITVPVKLVTKADVPALYPDYDC